MVAEDAGLPSPPDEPAALQFQGSVRSGAIGFGGPPFGHLRFDYDHLHIGGWSGGAELDVSRENTRVVLVSTWLLAPRVQVVYASGRKAGLWFSGGNRRQIVDGLRRRGWPVEERGRGARS